MKKIFLMMIITLTFIVGGCYTHYMYDTPTVYTKYTLGVSVDTYYPYYYRYYPYSYYWYKTHNYYYVNPHKNYYQHKNNNDVRINNNNRTKERTDIRNNSGTRNRQPRKR